MFDNQYHPCNHWTNKYNFSQNTRWWNITTWQSWASSPQILNRVEIFAGKRVGNSWFPVINWRHCETQENRVLTSNSPTFWSASSIWLKKSPYSLSESHFCRDLTIRYRVNFGLKFCQLLPYEVIRRIMFICKKSARKIKAIVCNAMCMKFELDRRKEEGEHWAKEQPIEFWDVFLRQMLFFSTWSIARTSINSLFSHRTS